MNLPIVDILRVGLAGLVFLLMFLCYRLLAREQSKKAPNVRILTNARAFLITCVALILVVAVTTFAERYFAPGLPAGVRTQIDECQQSVLRLQTLAAQPQQDVSSLRTLITNHVAICEPALRSMVN